MEKIKIRKRIKSSTLKIKELENYKDKEVEISITPIEEKTPTSTEELLDLSVWNITEEDIKMRSWQLEKY
jgi:hypothetical protein